MFRRSRIRVLSLFLICALFVIRSAAGTGGASWNGILTDGEGTPIAGAVATLHASSDNRLYTATAAADGKFAFPDIAVDTYEVSVKNCDKRMEVDARGQGRAPADHVFADSSYGKGTSHPSFDRRGWNRTVHRRSLPRTVSIPQMPRWAERRSPTSTSMPSRKCNRIQA